MQLHNYTLTKFTPAGIALLVEAWVNMGIDLDDTNATRKSKMAFLDECNAKNDGGDIVVEYKSSRMPHAKCIHFSSECFEVSK